MEPYVVLNVKNKVGYIEFFHPEHNAMPSDNLSQLATLIEEAGADDMVRVIVLRSGGNRTFCAGASFMELVSISDEKTGTAFFSGFARVINAMRQCPKLILVRVQGKAVGGGVGLAAAADYCLATRHAAVRLSELSIGIGPFVIEPVVSRKIGGTAMSQMSIDAETFYSAEWAKAKGLYAEVFETVEALDEGVDVLAQKLCGYHPEALQELKKVFWEGTGHWNDLLLQRAAISGRLVLSEFTKSTLKKFR
ncbi:enoyl-CoA hydratase/isomerase family protein [Aestuariivivens sediminicola]|uniref:enoyl-CoA hydratase/isomerase family protein n=1 Tax=Aestuariivivens sediminicola TaxID=2913560 RepID=UPI001F57EF88|nr:enoyl-CoA hydratase/isomerase family protein [Aestuariivivens sediminicola]